jgi:hypothetical protein
LVFQNTVLFGQTPVPGEFDDGLVQHEVGVGEPTVTTGSRCGFELFEGLPETRARRVVDALGRKPRAQCLKRTAQRIELPRVVGRQLAVPGPTEASSSGPFSRLRALTLTSPVTRRRVL